MSSIVSAAFWMLFLMVVAWVAIFGGVGALLARSRGGSAVAGLAWGVLLGPVGWIAIWWTTREPAAADPSTPAPALTPQPVTLGSAPALAGSPASPLEEIDEHDLD